MVEKRNPPENETERSEAPSASRLLILTRVGVLFQSSLEEHWIRHVLLSACTAGEGLGFNRAILFLLDKKRNELSGSEAMGQLSWEEAERVWSFIRERRLGLEQILASPESGDYSDKGDLNTQIRSLRIPLDPPAGLIARSAVKKRSYRHDESSTEAPLEESVRSLLGTFDVATCPLVCHEEVLGVVVVDNRFTGKPIAEEAMLMLSILCDQAAGAIRNARLYSQVENLNARLQTKVLAAGQDLVTLNEELRRSNRELRNAQAELIRKDRLAFLGEMAAIVAHEIRNPLTSIRGFAQRIARQCGQIETDSRIVRNSNIIVEEVDRLQRVLGDVLDLARRVNLRIEKADLNEIVRETLEFVSYDPGKLILQTELHKSLPKIQIDREQLKQVLLNLFRNAVQAMEGEGALLVRTRPVYDALEVEVSDTGPGIPEDIRDKIFTPFFSTKEHGTGLGLSLVQRIVEDHRGEVRVESAPGKGAVFRIRLPIGSA